MAYLDIILGLLILWGLYRGIKNGLLIEIASLIALVAAIYGAIHFSYLIGDYLAKKMEWDEKFINLSAFIVTFAIIVISITMAGKLLTKVVNFALLGMLNKVAGGIFGALKATIILGAFLVFLHETIAKIGFLKKETLEESILYAPVKEIGAFVFSAILKEDTKESL